MASGNGWSVPGSFMLLRRRVVTPICVALIALGGIGGTQAQEATPGGAAGGTACVTAAGAGAVSGAAATPADAAAATPVTDQSVIGTATTALQAFYTCQDENSVSGSYEHLAVSSVSSTADGSLLVEHQVQRGAQLLAGRATLADSGGTWSVTAIAPMTPKTDVDMVTISAKAGDGAVELSPASAEAKPAVSIHGINAEPSDQVIVVLKTPDGFDPASLTSYDPRALPDGVTLVGELPLAAGAEGDAIFLGLGPGAYAIYGVGTDGTLSTGAALTLTEEVQLDVPSIFDTPEATPSS